MRQRRSNGTRRIASWAERSLWALGLLLLAAWGYHQAAMRFEQARLEESFFAELEETAGWVEEADGSLGGPRVPRAGAQRAHPDDRAHAELAAAAPAARRELEPGAPVGLIEIGRLGVRAMVVEGVDNSALRRAVGHIPGTALPGVTGNTVLAAHRDTFFAGLRDAELGDRVTVRTDSGLHTYRVSSIDVVPPTAVEVMDPTPDPVLTLITCFPFDFVGPAPMRFIVRAELEGPAGENPGRPAADGRNPASELRRAGNEPALDGARGAQPKRPLDAELLSFLSGSLVKPGAS